MRTQKKSGVIISYITLFTQTLSGIFLAPFLINNLGAAEYGLYQLVHSFAGYLIILNFGTGTVITRYVAKYRAEKDDKSQSNFLFMSLFITAILSLVVLMMGFIFYFCLDKIFTKSLTLLELDLAKRLYILMIFCIALTIPSNAFTGMISGYERFAISNGFKLAKVVLRFIIIFVLLLLGLKSFAIILADLFIIIILIILEASYCLLALKIKVKFHYFDRKLLSMVFTFSLAIFLQTIINQVNQNVDRVILGVYTDTRTVALYSISLVIFTMLGSTTGAIGSVFVPQATRMVVANATKEELTDLVIRPGRLQFMVGGAAVAGFILLGRNFIKVWVGEDFLGAYLPTILLIIPMLIPLIQSVTNAILNALMKRLVSTIILAVMAGTNIVLTIIMVKSMGYIGAAVSTAISIFIGHILLINIYLYKYIGLNIFRMFREIFRGTWQCLLVSTIFSLPIAYLLEDTFVNFLIKAIFFLIIYSFLLFRFSMLDYEKNIIIQLIKRVKNLIRI